MKNLIINGKTYSKPVVVFAMEDEEVGEFKDFELVFTGIGKINATFHLLNFLKNNTTDLIINLGTAGGFGFSKEDVVCCNAFVQRDMDVTPLGIEKYKTPFSDEEIVLKYGLKLDNIPNGVCGTGDNFETEHSTDLYNVVDMESYALAYVAKQENIPFLCLKYISDGADDNAVLDWKEQLKFAAKKLKSVLDQFILED
jgi:adenosylhomocysteine nucleosidase